MVASEATSSIYIFGGYINSYCTKELWEYNTERNFWKAIKTAEGPSARANHAAVMWSSKEKEEKMVIIGGINANIERLSDVWVFSVKEKVWKEVAFAVGDLQITPRSEHSAIVYNDDVIVFGGRTNDLIEVNDTLAFNMDSLKWKVMSEACLKPSVDKQYSPMRDSPASKTGNTLKPNDISFTNVAVNENPSNSPNASPVRAKAQSPRMFSPLGKGKASPPKMKANEIESSLEERKLMTPVTSAMLRSVVISAGEKALEPYMQTMKKRKRFTGIHFSKVADEAECCAKGRLPCARSGHSASLYKKCVVIFGGDRKQVALNDIYLYELN